METATLVVTAKDIKHIAGSWECLLSDKCISGFSNDIT